MTEKRVFIAIPTFNPTCSTLTTNTILRAASAMYDVNFYVQSQSLLARNFNSCFCKAWRDHFHYFVILHADIGVSPRRDCHFNSWLDLLVNRTQQMGMAALSVVSPIKNAAGHTSLGLELSKDSHQSLRRVTIRELQKLPLEMIDRTDLLKLFEVPSEEAGALLINTGCLCMNLEDFPWDEVQWPGFHIDDEIGWSLDGLPDPYTTPEDWGFSRWLHEQSWPYCATRELEIAHMGEHIYYNDGLWGNEHDSGESQMSIKEWRKHRMPAAQAKARKRIQ